MGNDLPDFQSQIVSAAVEATSFRAGLDADKPASPAAGDIWLARDTYYLYVCFTAGSWEKVAKLYLPLAGGTMSGAIAMGAQKITGMADPTAAQDAATRAYVLAQVALYLALAGGTMTGPIAMGAQKITGMADPTAAQDAATRAYVLAQKALCLLLAGGTMSGAIAMGTNKITGLAAPAANADAARKLDVDTVDAKLDDVSQAQPAREKDTIYQNSTKIRVVTIYVTLDAAETASLQVLSSSPPTTIVARAWNGTDQVAAIGASMTAVILPNYYYRLASTLGTPTVGYWTEWDLF